MSNTFTEPSEWFMTDDDCLQHCRSHPAIDPQMYELVQIISFPGHVDGEPFYRVAHAHIDVKDYSDEEILSALNFFGYENMDDFVSQNSPGEDFIYKEDGSLDRENSPSYIIDYQLIAEMLFEMDAMEYADGEFKSWNDAVDNIAQLTGLDLTGCYEQDKEDAIEAENSLILGVRREGEVTSVFLSTPEEMAAILDMRPEELASLILNTHEKLGEDVATTFDGGKLNLMLSDYISQAPQNSANYIASSILEMKALNANLFFEKPSDRTMSVLCTLLAPIENAGFPNADIDASRNFFQKQGTYLEDLSEIFRSFGVMSVNRERASVTQGSSMVVCAGENIARYGDSMFLQNKDGIFTNGFRKVKDAQFYGPVIGGWGSITADYHFIKSALVKYPDRIKQALTKPTLEKETLPSLDDQIRNADARKDVPSSASKQPHISDKEI